MKKVEKISSIVFLIVIVILSINIIFATIFQDFFNADKGFYKKSYKLSNLETGKLYSLSLATFPYGANCKDSDNGLDYYTKGVTSTNTISYIDKCDKNILIEGYCVNNFIKQIKYDCDKEKKICKDGACINQKCFSVCQELNEPGKTYELCNNVIQTENKDCMIIKADNITLDCKGYSITSILAIKGVYSNKTLTEIRNCKIDTGTSSGIYIENTNNTYIHDNNLTGQSHGIYLKKVYNSHIIGNYLSFNQYHGLFLSNSSDNQINNNQINSISGNGIYLEQNSNYNNLDSNNLDSNIIGLYVSQSNYNIINNNSINSNNDRGIWLFSSSNNTLEDNQINNNWHYGIYLHKNSNNNILNNNIACNTIKAQDLYCLDSSRNTGEKNKFQNVSKCKDEWPKLNRDFNLCKNEFNATISLSTTKKAYEGNEIIELTGENHKKDSYPIKNVLIKGLEASFDYETNENQNSDSYIIEFYDKPVLEKKKEFEEEAKKI